jgi:hypothetical protein
MTAKFSVLLNEVKSLQDKQIEELRNFYVQIEKQITAINVILRNQPEDKWNKPSDRVQISYALKNLLTNLRNLMDIEALKYLSADLAKRVLLQIEYVDKSASFTPQNFNKQFEFILADLKTLAAQILQEEEVVKRIETLEQNCFYRRAGNQ